MNHPLFGRLENQNGYLSWAGTAELRGRAVPVELDCPADTEPEQLDRAARVIRELERFDAAARAALALDEDEGGVTRYLEDFDGARDELLARLELVRVWFAPEDDDQLACLDYRLGSARSLLAVRFDGAGNLAGIAVET